MYRDSVSHAWTSAENDANRATTLAGEEIRAAAAIAGAVLIAFIFGFNEKKEIATA